MRYINLQKSAPVSKSPLLECVHIIIHLYYNYYVYLPILYYNIVQTTFISPNHSYGFLFFFLLYLFLLLLI